MKDVFSYRNFGDTTDSTFERSSHIGYWIRNRSVCLWGITPNSLLTLLLSVRWRYFIYQETCGAFHFRSLWSSQIWFIVAIRWHVQDLQPATFHSRMGDTKLQISRFRLKIFKKKIVHYFVKDCATSHSISKSFTAYDGPCLVTAKNLPHVGRFFELHFYFRGEKKILLWKFFFWNTQRVSGVHIIGEYSSLHWLTRSFWFKSVIHETA